MVFSKFLFILYTPPPPGHIISSFNVTHHQYADDIQIYVALGSRKLDSSMVEPTECLTCIKKWMDDVKLQVKQNSSSLLIDMSDISYAIEVKNLGVTFDSVNTFASHIKVCCAATITSRTRDASGNYSVWRLQHCRPTQ